MEKFIRDIKTTAIQSECPQLSRDVSRTLPMHMACESGKAVLILLSAESL